MIKKFIKVDDLMSELKATRTIAPFVASITTKDYARGTVTACKEIEEEIGNRIKVYEFDIEEEKTEVEKMTEEDAKKELKDLLQEIMEVLG